MPDEEFIRLALSHLEIRFQLVYNDDLILPLRQVFIKTKSRQYFLKNDIEKTVIIVEEDTEKLQKYIWRHRVKQQIKTRGDQYLFVNHRFIKSNLLNHAITSAYEKIILPALSPFMFYF